ncbi:MAG TPA: hypothetical protein VNB64_01345 [Solirubrobacteraceae bacterium]|nr:hypothetical protein [Solirubrobacteraceae bacterium]
MAIIVATSTALVIWVVLWALGQKALDASLLALTIVVLVATARILVRQLPGRGDL